MRFTAEQLDQSRGARLLSADFDGTIANSFEPSPNKIDVNEAYRLGVDQVFGLKTLQSYVKNGEHKNRAPAEIVKSLAPDLAEDELKDKTDELTKAKLEILENEIGTQPNGTIWPKPIDGFLNCWERVTIVEPSCVDTAVISSGHTSFILKTFSLWGIKPPDILVTDEVIRAVQPDKPILEKTKPAPFPMEIALGEWASKRQLTHHDLTAAKAMGYVVYVGDDKNKDGGLARNTDVPFIHLDTDNAREIWESVPAALHLAEASLRGAEITMT